MSYINNILAIVIWAFKGTRTVKDSERKQESQPDKTKNGQSFLLLPSKKPDSEFKKRALLLEQIHTLLEITKCIACECGAVTVSFISEEPFCTYLSLHEWAGLRLRNRQHR